MFPNSNLKLGETKDIDLEELYTWSETIFSILNKFDDLLITKFSELII